MLLIAAAVGVVLAVASSSAGYFFDEMYSLAAGRDHLAWGYLDQPPLVPVLARLMDAIAPGSLLVFRLPVTIGAALTVVLTAAIARELGCARAVRHRGQRSGQRSASPRRSSSKVEANAGYWCWWWLARARPDPA